VVVVSKMIDIRTLLSMMLWNAEYGVWLSKQYFLKE
jgi:hypothetical protein